jgi:hypothetical protein
METIRWVGDGILTVGLVRRLGARLQKSLPAWTSLPLRSSWGCARRRWRTRKEDVLHEVLKCL